MSGTDDAEAELLRKFEAAISGMELADLRHLAGDLTEIGGRAALRSMRPELRRPSLDEVLIYRIRVDLEHAELPIWRRLDLRSDLPLDVVHQVLQVAFDWTDSHLHRFSLAGHPFDRTSQLFLCPYDVQEGEQDDEGIPAADVRLDETLQDPGDVMAYLYDYGDNWELMLRLEEILPASADAPSAVAVGGRRAAPPEDSGGGTDLANIALVVDDPAHFDLDELNQALRTPYFMLREHGVDQRLVDAVNRLQYSNVGEDLAQRMLTLVTGSTTPNDSEAMVAALSAHQWFLDRATTGGISLTSAGYLKPDDVEAASRIVPAMGGSIGKNNREVNAVPLLEFRESLQSIGLLRKRKGALLLTRAGAAAQRDPAKLWAHVAERLIPSKAGEFETVATLLMLAYAATTPDAPIPREQVAAALSELGWRHRDGRPVEGYEIYRLNAFNTIVNISDKQSTPGNRNWVSPEAAALSRAALRQTR